MPDDNVKDKDIESIIEFIKNELNTSEQDTPDQMNDFEYAELIAEAKFVRLRLNAILKANTQPSGDSKLSLGDSRFNTTADYIISFLLNLFLFGTVAFLAVSSAVSLRYDSTDLTDNYRLIMLLSSLSFLALCIWFSYHSQIQKQRKQNLLTQAELFMWETDQILGQLDINDR